MCQKTIFKIAPSGLDYALKCKRCLWLSHRGIKLDSFFPPIFNSFDLIQKKFLITQSVKLMSKGLRDGRIIFYIIGFMIVENFYCLYLFVYLQLLTLHVSSHV